MIGRRLPLLTAALTVVLGAPPARSCPGEIDFGFVTAATRAATAPAGRDRLDLRFQLKSLRHGNFFQAAPDRAGEDIGGGEVALRAVLDVDARGRLKAELGLQRTTYGRLGVSPGWSAALRFDGGVHHLEVGASGHLDRPIYEIREALTRSDALRLAGEYRLRLGDFDLAAAAATTRDVFDLEPREVSRLTGWELSARFRGLGRWFSPQLGLARAVRSGDNANDDFRERDREIVVRSAPVRWLYLSAGLRLRTRTYTVAEPAARNRGRSDERRQWKASGELRVAEHLSLGAYASRERSDSSRPGRDYVSSLVSLGLTIDF